MKTDETNEYNQVLNNFNQVNLNNITNILHWYLLRNHFLFYFLLKFLIRVYNTVHKYKFGYYSENELVHPSRVK